MTARTRNPTIHDRRLGRRRCDGPGGSGGAGGSGGPGGTGASDGGVADEDPASVGVTIPSEVSALLLTVVILGICVTAVVVDVLWGAKQPATDSVRSHRDYGAPWQEWLRAAGGWGGRLGTEMYRGARKALRAGAQVVRGTAASSRAGREVVREGVDAVDARRRARAQRLAAHARYVAHLQATRRPPPYPLPPRQAEPTAGSAGPTAPPPPPPPPTPALAVPPPGAEAHPETTEPPAPPPATPPDSPPPAPWPAPAIAGTTPLVQLRQATPADQRRARRQARGPISSRPPIVLPPRPAPQPPRTARTLEDLAEPGPGVPLTPPRRVRIRSALVVLMMTGMLGVVAASLVLVGLFLVVQALANV